jgi:hypothetical protein
MIGLLNFRSRDLAGRRTQPGSDQTAALLGLPKRGQNAKIRVGFGVHSENLGYVYFLY